MHSAPPYPIDKVVDAVDHRWKELADEGVTRVRVTADSVLKGYKPLVHRLCEEMRHRKATVTDFFLAYVHANTDNIQAALHYLDYMNAKGRKA